MIRKGFGQLAEAHDSLMFEVRLDFVEEFSDDFRDFCATPINFSKCSLSRDYDLVIPADVNFSKENWGAVK